MTCVTCIFSLNNIICYVTLLHVIYDNSAVHVLAVDLWRSSTGPATDELWLGRATDGHWPVYDTFSVYEYSYM